MNDMENEYRALMLEAHRIGGLGWAVTINTRETFNARSLAFADKLVDMVNLLRFAGKALEEVRGDWSGSDWDGGSLQDAMESCGLVASRPATASCGEECACSEFGFPTACLYETPLGVRARESLLPAARSLPEKTPDA